MSRNSSLVRALSLLRTLRDGRWTIRALADRFNVTTRTIRRDIAALEEAGEPVCKDYRPVGRGSAGEWWVLR